MIRHATSKDLDKIADAVRGLHSEAEHPFTPNKEIWIKAWSGMIDSGTATIFFGEEDGEVTGAIGGAFFPSLNTGLLQASELVYYVVPKFRNRAIGWTLYSLFKEEARKRKVAFMTMSTMAAADKSSGILEKFYLREGFKKFETVYIKEMI